MPREIDAVIFDMDGVLCDSEPLITAAAIEMFRRRYGLVVTPEDFRPFLGVGDDAFMRGVGRAHGIEIDLPADKALAYEVYLERAPDLECTPRLTPFVEELRAAGLRLAMATGADRTRVEANLAAIGLGGSMFETVVTAEDVTRKKPDPEPFLRALDGLRLPGQRCLVIEDAAHGVVAALAAGCRVVGVTSSLPAEALVAAGALAAFRDFTRVPPAIRELLGLRAA